MTAETRTQQVELPNGGASRKSGRSQSHNAPLPDIDHTIKIPERLAMSCWQAMLISGVIFAVAFLDARDPLFRIYVGGMFDNIVYWLSLENIIASIGQLYQGLIDITLKAFMAS